MLTKYFLIQEFHETATGERTLRAADIEEYVPTKMPKHLQGCESGIYHRAPLAEDGGDSLGFEVCILTPLGESIPPEHSDVPVRTLVERSKPFIVGHFYGIQYVDADGVAAYERLQYQGVTFSWQDKTTYLLFEKDGQTLPIPSDFVTNVKERAWVGVSNGREIVDFNDPNFPTEQFNREQFDLEQARLRQQEAPAYPGVTV